MVALCAFVLQSCGENPNSTAAKRRAKAAEDAIRLEQYEHTVAFCDSCLTLLTPKVDSLMTHFRYEKTDYEDHGHYVHSTLGTGRNAERCFIQPYVKDNYEITIRSYYYGTSHLEHTSVTLLADKPDPDFPADPTLRLEGTNHGFDAVDIYDGHEKTYRHEIMTFHGGEAEQLLNFIDAFRGCRIRIRLEGKGRYLYVLNDRDREALLDTWQLGVWMRDIHRLEAEQRKASAQVNRLQRRYGKAES